MWNIKVVFSEAADSLVCWCFWSEMHYVWIEKYVSTSTYSEQGKFKVEMKKIQKHWSHWNVSGLLRNQLLGNGDKYCGSSTKTAELSQLSLKNDKRWEYTKKDLKTFFFGRWLGPDLGFLLFLVKSVLPFFSWILLFFLVESVFLSFFLKSFFNKFPPQVGLTYRCVAY